MMLLPYPAIDPVALSLGPVEIRWYGISYVVGILLVWSYCLYLSRQMKLAITKQDINDFVPWGTLGVVFGGRLGQAIFYEFPYYSQHPIEILYLWRPGMSFHGGLLGVVFIILWFCHHRKISLLKFGDLIAAGVPIALFFGRIANFINGELFGRVTAVPWAMVFPYGGPFPRHPSQLYEAGLEGLLLFLILFFVARFTSALHRFPGLVFSFFLMGYGIFRSFAEVFREPDPSFGLLAGDTTWGQWLSAPVFLAGLLILFVSLWGARKAKPS